MKPIWNFLNSMYGFFCNRKPTLIWIQYIFNYIELQHFNFFYVFFKQQYHLTKTFSITGKLFSPKLRVNNVVSLPACNRTAPKEIMICRLIGLNQQLTHPLKSILYVGDCLEAHLVRFLLLFQHLHHTSWGVIIPG